MKRTTSSPTDTDSNPSSPTDTDSNPTNVTAAYDYNNNGTAVRTLNNEAVNTYAAVQTTLDGLRLKNDRAAFDAQLDKFIAETLQQLTPTDAIPSYAPRGSNRSMNVSVKDGVIDYSNYELEGDANNDGSVDFKDIEILKDALYSGAVSDDVNHDDVIDIKDVVYALARLNTEIASFDFYDTSYAKLAIARRTFDEAKIFSYDGNLTAVIAVAKDSNGASGFDGVLSDSADVWYKKSGWVYSDTTLLDENPKAVSLLGIASSQMVRDTVRDVTNIEPSPYLIGWHLSVGYVETGSFDGFGETDIDQFSMFLTEGKNKIDSHFIKSNMGTPGSVTQTLNQYLYYIGSTNGITNEVKAHNISYADVYTNDGDRIAIRRVVQAASVLYESVADNTLVGNVNAGVTLNGEITLDRIGPSPQEETFKGSVSENSIEVKNIPFGEYTATMDSACQCPLTLGNLIYDSPSAQANFSVNDTNTQGTIAINILDSADVPLANKRVTIEQDACLDQGVDGSSLLMSEAANTDDLGEALFQNMPFGDYKVSVDGIYIKTIQVCASEPQTIRLNSLWSLKIDYVLPTLTSGSVTYKNFTLDCVNTLSSPDALVASSTGAREIPACAYVNDGFLDMRTDQLANVSYSGGITADPNLGSDMTIATEGIVFQAYVPLFELQISSIIWDGYYSHGPLEGCFGNFTSNTLNDIKAGKKTSWSSMSKGDGTGYCDFVLEPCQNEACE